MKALVILGVGVVLFVVGFLLKAEAENWSLVSLNDGAHTGANQVYTVDEHKEKTYYSTGEELCILGAVLAGVAAFRWTSTGLA